MSKKKGTTANLALSEEATSLAPTEAAQVKVTRVTEENGEIRIHCSGPDGESYGKAAAARAEAKAIAFAERMATQDEYATSDPAVRKLLIAASLPEEAGPPASRHTIAQLMASLPGGSTTQELVNSIAPRDGVEALLATQMAAIHYAAINAARRIESAEYLEQAKQQEGALNRLARTFASQVEALRKHRTGGEQTVRHVHVNDGGQAIVAETINSNRIQGEGGDG